MNNKELARITKKKKINLIADCPICWKFKRVFINYPYEARISTCNHCHSRYKTLDLLELGDPIKAILGRGPIHCLHSRKFRGRSAAVCGNPPKSGYLLCDSHVAPWREVDEAYDAAAPLMKAAKVYYE
jgi:hypothetical protein